MAALTRRSGPPPRFIAATFIGTVGECAGVPTDFEQ